MSRPACSIGGESGKRSASWAGYTAGNTKRSAEKVSASRNRGSSFLVRVMIIASWIPSLVTNNCPKSSKPRRPTGTVYVSDQVSLMKHDLADLPRGLRP